MQRLAPYQTGIWLAEHFNNRCQLCSLYRSVPVSYSSSNSSRFGFYTSSLLCVRCQDSIVWRPTAFDVDIAVGITLPIQAATYYEYPIRQAFAAFKHSEDMTKLPLLVHILRQLPKPIGCDSSNSVIVPMPTTNERLCKRGFDPVTILSSYLSKHWQIPLWHGIQRTDDTISQQGLTRSERLANLNDAFVVTQPPQVKKLLLFDDVATTGASLQALARTLHEYITTTHNSQSSIYQISAYALAHGSG